MWTQRLCVTLMLAVPLWCQTEKSKILPTTNAARQVRRIQMEILSTDVIGDAKSDQARRDREFAQFKKIVSDYVIAQVEAAPDINWWELRSPLVQILGDKHDARHSPENPLLESPHVFLGDPGYRKTGPVVFSVVYKGDACVGVGCARTVIDVYVIDQGKVRLAGRGGSELNGIDGGAQQVGADEALIQGQVLWASGHVLPYKAVLYRVSETGVKTVWQSPITPGLSATVFGEHLLVEYHDEKRDTHFNDPKLLDVYSLENSVPKLVFRREF
jgi:hypothetical protein